MKRSRPKYSRWISLLVLFLAATVALQGQSGAVDQNNYTTGRYVYQKATCKATVIFHGQELSGRMIFKRTAEDTVLVAFFNELGVSYVEGGLSFGGRQHVPRRNDEGSAVGGRRSAVGGQDSANGELRTANRFEFVKLAPFLEYKSFRKNFEKGLLELLVDEETGLIELPENSGEAGKMMIFKKGRKFQLGLRL